MHSLDIDWQEVDGEVQVTVLGRFTAADQRRMDVSYQVDVKKLLVHLRCRVHSSGKQYHHDSVLRGFCSIPRTVFKDSDPDSCDWRAEILES